MKFFLKPFSKKMIFTGMSLILFALSCSSGPKVKQQAYATLPAHRVFEFEFPVVWNGIEIALKNQKIIVQDPKDVSTLELKKLTKRSLETDWIYSQSQDKYQEYKINDSPRKKALQVRYRYFLKAKSVLGGTEVVIQTEEEIERLNSDGTSAGYSETDAEDSSLSSGLLDKIQFAILAAP
jgi:hypothetical protein